jgi:hypothetical protein
MAEKTKTVNPGMAERGRARREQLGMSKTELALKLNIGTGRLNQMELEGVEGLSTIERWAKALNMDRVELCFGEPVQPGRGKTGCDHKFVDSKCCLKCGWCPPPRAADHACKLPVKKGAKK